VIVVLIVMVVCGGGGGGGSSDMINCFYARVADCECGRIAFGPLSYTIVFTGVLRLLAMCDIGACSDEMISILSQFYAVSSL
jgi:hypothetical protein